LKRIKQLKHVKQANTSPTQYQIPTGKRQPSRNTKQSLAKDNPPAIQNNHWQKTTLPQYKKITGKRQPSRNTKQPLAKDNPHAIQNNHWQKIALSTKESLAKHIPPLIPSLTFPARVESASTRCLKRAWLAASHV